MVSLMRIILMLRLQSTRFSGLQTRANNGVAFLGPWAQTVKLTDIGHVRRHVANSCKCSPIAPILTKPPSSLITGCLGVLRRTSVSVRRVCPEVATQRLCGCVTLSSKKPRKRRLNSQMGEEAENSACKPHGGMLSSTQRSLTANASEQSGITAPDRSTASAAKHQQFDKFLRSSRRRQLARNHWPQTAINSTRTSN